MAFIFIAFEIIAGFFQLLAALLLDHHAAKLKYIIFAPLYMLFFWMINPITVVTTFIPALKTIFGLGSGTWVSPERKSLQNKVGHVLRFIRETCFLFAKKLYKINGTVQNKM